MPSVGTNGSMEGIEGEDINFEPADHAMGLELQIVELVEQQQRARVQHRTDDTERLEGEIAALRAELVRTAEAARPTGG